MKNIAGLILLFTCFTVNAQKTIPKEVKGENEYEVYSVLKKKPYTKHGVYKRYQSVDDRLLEEGAYAMGKRAGIWSYYGWKGELYKKYDYASEKIVFYNPAADTVTDLIRANGKTERVRLEWPVEYTGGDNALWKHIHQHLSYPEDARENGISGIVYVAFFIDTAGVASGHYILQSAQKILDEEALRVAKLIPNNRLPGKYNGEAVEVIYILPFKFTIV